jgi:hypothetical protein
MAHYKLETTLTALTKSLDGMERFVNAARQWVYVAIPKGVPRFTVSHMEMVTEMAFLRCFLAWEAFLEESFILYLQGKNAPGGKMPKCYVQPPTREVAEQIIVPDGREYADWAKVRNVIRRAERFFRDGEPYSGALKSQQDRLQHIETVRNAIAHSSIYSWEGFQKLVRRELGTFPPNMTVGGFLEMTTPRSSPPMSYLEFYLAVIRLVADRIVPV